MNRISLTLGNCDYSCGEYCDVESGGCTSVEIFDSHYALVGVLHATTIPQLDDLEFNFMEYRSAMDDFIKDVENLIDTKYYGES